MYRLMISLVLASALVLAPLSASGVEPDDPASRFERAPSAGPLSPTELPPGIAGDRRVSVVFELAQDPVAVVTAEQGDLTDGQAAAIRRQLERAQAPVVEAIEDAGGNVEATLQSAYNGVQASIAADEVAEVAQRRDVVAVHVVRAQTIENATSVPFLGVPQVWQSTGFTGDGVKVAIIDTGIDYTHAAFAGPGTPEAFAAARATSTAPADPALFGPGAPRIKGGYDFVGDDYNANNPTSVPRPDPNPLDCEGHGSHVAGTAGGGGVTPDGTAYTGPYGASLATSDWQVGPGVAPQADLYALRVFGCAGSTNLTVAAIDWAVENQMDVINMSLGSDFGRADDPTAVASTNAIGAGVVVVASAGNAGPSPYIAGSPGSGDGVISVAATDSTETFSGALLTVDGQQIEAINANGADLDGLGTLSVVRLQDDPATTDENEAQGCSLRAYRSNGIVPGGNQLAVSERGTCARVARAVFAQQTGAAAALMVNNTDTLPPFEGEITSNPDTGEAYTVTIPFLGVASSDGPALTTGATVTVAAAELENPEFRRYASFSSDGPRGGDSALSVDIAAPGVSIVSAAVGSGAGGTTLSGTSMAAPHVAGVAALTVQSKPRWRADEIAAAVVGSADPEAVAGQDLTRGGVGLVDAAQAVATQITATGDSFRTESGRIREASLSMGFQESARGFSAVKTMRVTNRGTRPVTYRASVVPTEESAAARVRLNRSSVTVRPGRTAVLVLTLSARADAVPGSVSSEDQFAFREFSGQVQLTSSGSTLRVPYLLVPRSDSQVTAAGSSLRVGRPGDGRLTLRNTAGAAAADADVYTWGLSDPRDVPRTTTDTGFDLASAGVQSLDTPDGKLVVFALNNHRRWSNASVNSFEVPIDRDGDGTEDVIVFSADSGQVRTGFADGLTEVFLFDVATRAVSATGFLATAPTDSSTMLLPVFAADLGLTAQTGAFSYSAAGYGLGNPVPDVVEGSAAYDPWAPALQNGQLETVPTRGTVQVPVGIDAARVAEQRPRGVMAVVLDNRSGTSEAVLVPVRR